MKNKFDNIIYICTSEKNASGGAKIIYDHSKIINESKNEFNSQIIHIKKKKSSKWKNSLKKLLKIDSQNYSGWQFNDIEIKKNFKYDWFKNININLKEDFIFNQNDLIIFPEIFAHLAKKLCIDKNIDFGIFVQNGYALHSTNDQKTLTEVYDKSKIILSYSKKITECIEITFPNSKKKIFKIRCSVEPKIKKIKKRNIITYMPRKMHSHSSKLLLILNKYLPKNWKVISINNISQEKVYEKLLTSKIFLSFSELEGLGLPPLEAAILGNKVIGYTGEGGNEYFKKPIFTKINSGDLLRFNNEILKQINNKNFLKSSKSQKNILKRYFSKKNEKNYILKFLKTINIKT